jgi:uncharacterized damage-inducible protein DinB
MALSDTLIPEYDMETSTTRRVLERLADDQLGWKPHEKSMSLGRLSTHLAELASLGQRVLGSDSFDIAGGGYQPQTLGSRDEILALYDKNVAATRAALASMSDQELLSPWTFRRGEQTIFKAPKIAALRTLMINHSIHHRGQLTVYLRQTGSLVPSVYGPSADESV